MALRRRARSSAPSSAHPVPADAGDAMLAERLRRIEDELTAVAGGASLCSISKTAGSVPTAKYLEGRMVAARALRRAHRTQPERRLRSVVAELAATWSDQLRAVTDRDAGPGWVAYRAGGVDELDELAARPAEPPDG